MTMPLFEDVKLFHGDEFDHSAFFTGPIASWTRRDDTKGAGEWISIRYEAGGVVEFLTASRLVFIEPERH